jgi:glycosyltransferase involved in cell wall biosynthesis
MSTRNRGKYLGQALDNLREFMTPADELIIFDGGSTDETSAVVAANRDVVTRFVSEPDLGEAHGYNKGILASSGEYIKFITDDDYTFPDGMRAAIALLDAHPEIDALLCGGESLEIRPETEQPQLRAYLWLPAALRLRDSIDYVFNHTTCGLGLILRRRVIARAGLFDTSFVAADKEYFGKLFACGADFRYAHVKLFRHIEHPHSNQRRLQRCRQDCVRMLLRNGEWEKATNPIYYPLADAGAALGLERVARGDELLSLMEAWNDLRWGRLPYLGTLHQCARLLRFSRRLLNQLQPVVPDGVNGPLKYPAQDILTEPVWDGSLR